MAETEIIIEPGRQDIVFRHVFDAPREVVWKALTDPALIPNWYGPRKYEAIVDYMEVKPGGRWRFINRGPEGDFGFHGVYHDVVAPERIVQTNEFEGVPGHVGLETGTLTQQDGKTTFESIALFPSVEDRDMNVANGMGLAHRPVTGQLEVVGTTVHREGSLRAQTGGSGRRIAGRPTDSLRSGAGWHRRRDAPVACCGRARSTDARLHAALRDRDRRTRSVGGLPVGERVDAARQVDARPHYA